MFQSLARRIAGILVAAAGVYGGIRLGIYAEQDDARGGVVIAMGIMFGSLALGLWIAFRSVDKGPSDGG